MAHRAPVAKRKEVLQHGARQREQATAQLGIVILADQVTRIDALDLLGVSAHPCVDREGDTGRGRGGRAEAPPSHLELAPSRVGAQSHGW